MGVDFLGEIPLVNDIREFSDSGNPITISRPEVYVNKRTIKRCINPYWQSEHTKAYVAIAEKILNKLETPHALPKISFQ